MSMPGQAAQGIGLGERLQRLCIERGAAQLQWGVDCSELLKLAPGQRFFDAALDYACGFCPPGRAAMAVGRIKRAVQAGAEVPLETGLALERELQQQLFQSTDAREGIRAYVEKRQAQFQGK